ncbi:hypothetical protein, partial [Anaplasma marginale]|uniref:hypothetical protein n=1 Tax=Anaplasma marginale TaxID=770 RepID=UPI001CDB40BC
MAAPRAVYGDWWAFLGKRFAYIGLSVVLVAQRTSCGYNIGAGPLDHTHNMSRATLRQKRGGGDPQCGQACLQHTPPKPTARTTVQAVAHTNKVNASESKA